MAEKYSADWIKEQVQPKAKMPMRDCSICGYELSYQFEGDDVYFDAGCYCLRNGPNPPHKRTYADVARHLEIQSSDEIRDRIMAEVEVAREEPK